MVKVNSCSPFYIIIFTVHIRSDLVRAAINAIGKRDRALIEPPNVDVVFT
jgi:hypothetical protein